MSKNITQTILDVVTTKINETLMAKKWWKGKTT